MRWMLVVALVACDGGSRPPCGQIYDACDPAAPVCDDGLECHDFGTFATCTMVCLGPDAICRDHAGNISGSCTAGPSTVGWCRPRMTVTCE